MEHLLSKLQILGKIEEISEKQCCEICDIQQSIDFSSASDEQKKIIRRISFSIWNKASIISQFSEESVPNSKDMAIRELCYVLLSKTIPPTIPLLTTFIHIGLIVGKLNFNCHQYDKASEKFDLIGIKWKELTSLRTSNISDLSEREIGLLFKKTSYEFQLLMCQNTPDFEKSISLASELVKVILPHCRQNVPQSARIMLDIADSCLGVDSGSESCISFFTKQVNPSIEQATAASKWYRLAYEAGNLHPALSSTSPVVNEVRKRQSAVLRLFAASCVDAGLSDDAIKAIETAEQLLGLCDVSPDILRACKAADLFVLLRVYCNLSDSSNTKKYINRLSGLVEEEVSEGSEECVCSLLCSLAIPMYKGGAIELFVNTLCSLSKKIAADSLRERVGNAIVKVLVLLCASEDSTSDDLPGKTAFRVNLALHLSMHAFSCSVGCHEAHAAFCLEEAKNLFVSDDLKLKSVLEWCSLVEKWIGSDERFSFSSTYLECLKLKTCVLLDTKQYSSALVCAQNVCEIEQSVSPASYFLLFRVRMMLNDISGCRETLQKLMKCDGFERGFLVVAAQTAHKEGRKAVSRAALELLSKPGGLDSLSLDVIRVLVSLSLSSVTGSSGITTSEILCSIGSELVEYGRACEKIVESHFGTSHSPIQAAEVVSCAGFVSSSLWNHGIMCVRSKELSIAGKLLALCGRIAILQARFVIKSHLTDLDKLIEESEIPISCPDIFSLATRALSLAIFSFSDLSTKQGIRSHIEECNAAYEDYVTLICDGIEGKYFSDTIMQVSSPICAVMLCFLHHVCECVKKETERVVKKIEEMAYLLGSRGEKEWRSDAVVVLSHAAAICANSGVTDGSITAIGCVCKFINHIGVELSKDQTGIVAQALRIGIENNPTLHNATVAVGLCERSHYPLAETRWLGVFVWNMGVKKYGQFKTQECEKWLCLGLRVCKCNGGESLPKDKMRKEYNKVLQEVEAERGELVEARKVFSLSGKPSLLGGPSKKHSAIK
ncbi:hypothetical protein ADUPG1_011999 [Aduncisulcus paluster]|uniref:Uncharacterized protein n=1 Tax=Aduncisulcus paluster TaxID=2918883 RepID=A0ABQ5JXX6_9EUKA|nr:hypothetical protein ADUPG1_011999 [Aduncisulcus paluster]